MSADNLIRKSVTSAILKSDDAKGVVEAIVNTTGGEPDRQGDVVVPGAWKKAIAALAQKQPKVVWHHENGLTSDRLTVAGKITALKELLPGDPSLPDDIRSAGRGALLAKMQFNLSTQVGREVYSNVANAYVDEWSVGFLPEEAGYNKQGGYNEIKSAYPLLEVSPVLMGASVGTATISAKSDVSSQEQRRGARFSIDTPDGPKYPINDCSDVSDAWHLRGRSSLDQSRVERHIRHAANELHCNGPWNGKSLTFDELKDEELSAERIASMLGEPLSDQSTDESITTAADTANGIPTTRAEESVVVLETTKKSSSRSTKVANEPTVEPTVGPVRYLEANEAREMFAEVVKAALDKQTLDETRPTSLTPGLTDEAQPTQEVEKRTAEGMVAKGYFSPMARRDGFEVKSFSVNKFPQGGIENFSVARFAMAQAYALNNVMGDLAYRKVAPWETAYIEAGMKVQLVNPITKANMGDMVSGQDGGFLAPEQWNQSLYDLLYPSSILSQLPVTRQAVPTRVVHWPVLSNNVTVFYVGENSALTASSPQFRQITATMRKQAVLAYLSNELIRDSSPQADAILRQHAAIEMAIDQDAAALAGNGQNGAPRGLLNMSGFNSATPAAAHLAYTDLTKGIFNVETLNASTITRVGQAGCTGIAANPVLKKQLANLVDSNNRPLWDYSLRNVNISASPAGSGQMPNPGAPLAGFLNVPVWALSNNNNTTAGNAPLPLTEGSQNIFFGDWRWLIIAERMDIEFMASNVAGNTFANDQTAIRLIRRYDVVCPHPEAFFALTGASS